ncbi:MAG: PD40 domain-containing protein, partial [Bacteroidia bacterium]|nr:PD40 domain-containing protein [Bacteroidia bacterium]
MNKFFTLLSASIIAFSANAQNVMTTESLLELGKVGAMGVTKDGKSIIYNVRKYSAKEGKATNTQYIMTIAGGDAKTVENAEALLNNNRLSPDGKYIISSKEVKVKNVFGTDFYPELTKSDVMIYETLNNRHWDTWEDGLFGHVFVSKADGSEAIDIMPNEPHDCPQKPFGGDEDFIWSPDSKNVLYVTKKKYGTAYAISTNTDIYQYNIETKITKNLTEGMMGYDIKPSYSSTGMLAFLSMKTDGYESDKNDIIVFDGKTMINLTKDWDGTVDDYRWSNDGKSLYFTAANDGT